MVDPNYPEKWLGLEDDPAFYWVLATFQGRTLKLREGSNGLSRNFWGGVGVKAGGVIFPHEPRQKNKQTTYFLFYWLFSRDPYFMVSEIIPI